MKNYPRVLVIAGSDSGGGAGIQADIKAISACGAYAATAITAVTVQNTRGVEAVHVIPAEVVAAQIDAVMSDIGADAVKIGVLPNAQIVNAVADALERHGAPDILLDPVMVASSGDELIDNEAIEAIIRRLLPMATLVTPNIPEAQRMSSMRVASEADFEAAAKRLTELGAHAILLKAGHLEAPILTDHLFTPNATPDLYAHERVKTPNTHGTGCSLASAIAAFLAQGEPLTDAVAKAEAYLQGAIKAGAKYRLGSGHGPVHHLYQYWG